MSGRIVRSAVLYATYYWEIPQWDSPSILKMHTSITYLLLRPSLPK